MIVVKKELSADLIEIADGSFKVTKGSEYKLSRGSGYYKRCTILSAGEVVAIEEGCVAIAEFPDTVAIAEGDFTRAIASGKGSKAYANGRSSGSEAVGEGTTAHAKGRSSIARAQYEYAEAYADGEGTMAYAQRSYSVAYATYDSKNCKAFASVSGSTAIAQKPKAFIRSLIALPKLIEYTEWENMGTDRQG